MVVYYVVHSMYAELNERTIRNNNEHSFSQYLTLSLSDPTFLDASAIDERMQDKNSFSNWCSSQWNVRQLASVNCLNEPTLIFSTSDGFALTVPSVQLSQKGLSLSYLYLPFLNSINGCQNSVCTYVILLYLSLLVHFWKNRFNRKIIVSFMN